MTYRFIFSIVSLLIITWTPYLQGQTLVCTLGSESGLPGDTVSIPVAVDNFHLINGYQGSIRWDSTALEFLNFSSLNLNPFTALGDPGEGFIPLDAATFAWADLSGTGKNLPPGSVILEIQFVIKASAPFGVFPVVLDSSVTPLAYTSVGTSVSPLIANDGAVKVVDSTTNCVFCQNITLYLDSLGQANINPDELDGGSIVLSGSPNFSASQDSFDCSDIGVNQVMLYVSDGSGLIDSCSALVTVIDSLAPTAICKNITIPLDSNGLAVIDASMIDSSSIDACGIQSMSLSRDTFDCSDVGTHPVSLYISDLYGLIDSCSALVTVIDSLAPTAICRDITIPLDSNGLAVIDASMVDSSSVDVCGIQSMSLSQDTFGISDTGVQEIFLIVTDSSGNADSCVATVTIEKTTSIEDVFMEETTVFLQLYPNPADKLLHLEWESPSFGEVSIAILNQLGQEIHQAFRTKSQSVLEASLEVQDLSTGIYVVQVKQDSVVRHMRLVKE
ncbi:MAG: T9SS type A sorting domain-containing protein [Bacteroidota bacterium]